MTIRELLHSSIVYKTQKRVAKDQTKGRKHVRNSRNWRRKQYQLEEGRYVDIELLDGEKDSKVVFDKIVMIVNGKKNLKLVNHM